MVRLSRKNEYFGIMKNHVEGSKEGKPENDRKKQEERKKRKKKGICRRREIRNKKNELKMKEGETNGRK